MLYFEDFKTRETLIEIDPLRTNNNRSYLIILIRLEVVIFVQIAISFKQTRLGGCSCRRGREVFVPAFVPYFMEISFRFHFIVQVFDSSHDFIKIRIFHLMIVRNKLI